MSVRNKIVAATPLIALITFLTIGFTTGIWHPTWVVFFSIFIVPDLLTKRFYLKIYPLVVLAVYLTLGFYFGIWHPLWIIFLTIPVYYILFGRGKDIKRIEDKDSERIEVL